MKGQMTLFDYTRPMIHIDTPIRLIETFAGYGSQAMALRNIGADFTHHRVYEIDKYAIASYNAIHGTNFEPTDICEVRGGWYLTHDHHNRRDMQSGRTEN